MSCKKKPIEFARFTCQKARVLTDNTLVEVLSTLEDEESTWGIQDQDDQTDEKNENKIVPDLIALKIPGADPISNKSFSISFVGSCTNSFSWPANKQITNDFELIWLSLLLPL